MLEKAIFPKAIKSISNSQPLSSNTVGSANVAGTRFADISNPYASLPRQRTFWDKVLNALGMRSGYDKAQEQYNLAGAEYNAQLEQLASEEAYNSPLQQAQRMREAGLNPDLTGVSGEPASEFDNQQQSPDVSADSDVVGTFNQVQNVISSFASTALGSLGTVASIANTIGNVVRNFQDIGTNSLTQSGGIIDAVTKLSGSLLNDPRFPGEDPNIFLDEYSDIFQSLFPNRRMRKRVIGYLNDYYGSLQNVINEYKPKNELAGIRTDYNTLLGQSTYSDRDDYMQDYIRELSKSVNESNKAMNDFMKSYYSSLNPKTKASAENAEAGFKAGYNASLNASALAGAQNAEADARTATADVTKQLAEVQLEVQRSYEKFMKFLADKANTGGWFAQLVNTVVGANMANQFHLPNLSLGASMVGMIK